jgi:thiol-disulfide isomerase/thioredoxin
MLAVIPLALFCATSALRACAAGQTEAPKSASAGICTDGINADPTAVSGGKHIWADSHLFADAPALEVGKWLTDKPEMEGKFLVVEFWRTWCGACKRMTPLLNALQKKFGSELVVIGITGETEEAVKAYAGPKRAYFLALDRPRPAGETAEPARRQPEADEGAAPAPDSPCQTAGRAGEQGQYEAAFGVWGWPHVVILEPQHRTVVWEGFPGLKGYELTEAKVEKMLAIGREMKAEAKEERERPFPLETNPKAIKLNHSTGQNEPNRTAPDFERLLR